MRKRAGVAAQLRHLRKASAPGRSEAAPQRGQHFRYIHRTMSGPITVLVHPGLALPVMMAAAAIRAARAVQQAHANAAALHDAHADQRHADGVRQSAAQQRGEAALQAQAAAAEQRLAQLATLSVQWGGGQALEVARPQRPESADIAALAAYVRGLEAFADEAQRQLITVWAGQPAAAGEGDGLEALDALALAAAKAVPTAPQRPSERLLARIAHLGPVPAELQAVAQELDQTPEPMRAELLATELRRRVQLYAQAALAEEVQRAQALVMEQSLMDLGYQVDGIESTLFVEGGVAHFRKSHWGEYMVRMRVADAGRSINFNVVRAVADEAAAEAPTVQDHLAEDRWCAEFPALLKALAARGMQLDVTRCLEAGELPVQRVRRDQLPQFADAEAETQQSAAPALARPLP